MFGIIEAVYTCKSGFGDKKTDENHYFFHSFSSFGCELGLFSTSYCSKNGRWSSGEKLNGQLAASLKNKAKAKKKIILFMAIPIILCDDNFYYHSDITIVKFQLAIIGVLNMRKS